MHRIDHLHIPARRNFRQTVTDIEEAFPEILTSMTGHQNHAFIRVDKIEPAFHFRPQTTITVETFLHIQQSVDYGVASDEDIFFLHPFAAQVFRRTFRWGKTHVADDVGQQTVHFLRPGGVDIPCAQTASTWPTGIF